MNIDRDTPICGVKPFRLKALMRHDRFDTPKAMLLLGMAEPHISETLRQLADAGWVSWDGDRESIDQWRSTSLGHRLAASRLIRRFPISQGRALLPKIVEAACTLNANPSASHRIADQSLERTQNYAVMVRIVKQHEADVTIECNALDIDTFEELADIRILVAPIHGSQDDVTFSPCSSLWRKPRRLGGRRCATNL